MAKSSELLRKARSNGTARMSRRYLELFGKSALTMSVDEALKFIGAGLTGGARRDCKMLLKILAHSPWQVTTGLHRGRRGPKANSVPSDNTLHFDLNCCRHTYHCRLTAKKRILFEITRDGHGAISGDQFFRGPADAEGVGPRNK
jgi:hypothetical protein